MIIIYSIIYSNIGGAIQTSQVKELSKIIPYILIALLLYVSFMILNDVPMYIERAKKNKSSNAKYNSFEDLLKNLKKCRKVKSSFKEWKEDIPWLSLYFTFSVWGSIYILKWAERFKKLK
jgi:hypothetical protein